MILCIPTHLFLQVSFHVPPSYGFSDEDTKSKAEEKSNGFVHEWAEDTLCFSGGRMSIVSRSTDNSSGESSTSTIVIAKKPLTFASGFLMFRLHQH